MLFNHNARAFCRDCKQNCIPVHREVRVGHSVNITEDTKRFIDTDDSIIRLRCPLCGSYKLTSKPSVSDEEMKLVTDKAIAIRAYRNIYIRLEIANVHTSVEGTREYLQDLELN